MFSRINNFAIFIVLIVSLISVVSAVILENFLNFIPCDLCRIQQALYIILLITSGYVFFIHTKRSIWADFFITILIIANLLTSGYQSLVQMKVIDPYFKCSRKTEKIKDITVEDVILKLKHYRGTIAKNKPSIDCYQSDDKILGLTFAQYNFILSLFLLLVMFFRMNQKGNRYG